MAYQRKREVHEGQVLKDSRPVKHPAPQPGDTPRRACIMEAAYDVLAERGYARVSMLEIATRARVSKRDLYAEFGTKQGIYTAMVKARVARMQRPLELPPDCDRSGLALTLQKFGAAVLREVSSPAVTTLYRLAVAEAKQAPELAEAIDQAGRDANLASLAELLGRAQALKLLGPGDPREMATLFLSLLWNGGLHVRLLMGVARAPGVEAAEARAVRAVEILFALHAAEARGAAANRAAAAR